MSEESLFVDSNFIGRPQARNRLGTPGGAKSFRRGVKNF